MNLRHCLTQYSPSSVPPNYIHLSYKISLPHPSILNVPALTLNPKSSKYQLKKFLISPFDSSKSDMGETVYNPLWGKISINEPVKLLNSHLHLKYSDGPGME